MSRKTRRKKKKKKNEQKIDKFERVAGFCWDERGVRTPLCVWTGSREVPASSKVNADFILEFKLI